jgi:predicted Fe-Mo cluster-binding NifX family protein
MQEFYEDLLKASGFEVISWVSGTVDDLLALFIRGELEPGDELPGHCGPDLISLERMTEQ